MKHIFFLSLLLSFFLASIGQTKQDSISRAKADALLKHFDSSPSSKLLYSISNEHYYVMLENNGAYKEYYIHTDSAGNITEKRAIKGAKRNKKLLAKAFELSNYHRKFITKIENPKAEQGNPSYFVVKDFSGNRYGEYSLSAITSPIPIDGELYKYFLSKLLKESTKNIKG